MNPIRHIRTKVLKLTQAEFARVANSTQATVSRWEKDELEPTLEQVRLIRAEVLRKKKRWDDRWFFEQSRPAA